MIDKPPRPPAGATDPRPEPYVVVPHVREMLCEATTRAVMEWGGSYTFEVIDPGDVHAYGKHLVRWWSTGVDLVVIEQDVVPAPGMIAGLIECPHPWCGHPYHVGGGTYTYGLGFCKIGAEILTTWPGAASLAMRDYRGVPERMEWTGVNEAIDRQLSRYGYAMHLHTPAVPHLHYPPGGGDGR